VSIRDARFSAVAEDKSRGDAEAPLSGAISGVAPPVSGFWRATRAIESHCSVAENQRPDAGQARNVASRLRVPKLSAGFSARLLDAKD
jgi:hypothetical protein